MQWRYEQMKGKDYVKRLYEEMPDGYRESIQKGLNAAHHFSGHMSFGSETEEERISRLKNELETADAVVIGAGAGLSTAAGLTYSGERFQRYFFDFAKKYGIRDIYTGGFYPFPDEETRWAWWARHIYFNRYIDPPKPVYQKLLSLVKDKDYFAVTTNVDHQFQVNPLLQKTYDNEDWVRKAMEAQGFVKDADGIYQVPEDRQISMRIPTDLIPKCPEDGSDVTMNLRADDLFVEDEGWHRASAAYSDFLRRHENLHVLYLELGVGANTPVIVKYPFWQMTLSNEKAVYACVNFGEAFCPREIEKQCICIDGDIADVLEKIKYA